MSRQDEASKEISLKNALIIAIVAACLPIVVNGIVSFGVYLSVRDIEDRIQTIHTRSNAIDLYNKLAPNMEFQFEPMKIHVSHEADGFSQMADVMAEIAYRANEFSELESEDSEEFIQIFDPIKVLDENESGAVKEYPFIVTFDYCLTNHGNIEQWASIPGVGIKNSNQEYVKVDLINPVPIGTISAGQRGCQRADVKFSDIIDIIGGEAILESMGEIHYYSSVTVQPSSRSIGFIYNNNKREEIEKVAETFKFTLSRRGSKKLEYFTVNTSISGM